ncbi:uncharacterized protein CMU_041370 [Cryptosporidium muris RN66]|uniref:Fringe-like glycosyltransferase domain-containing protein n=1 Tax=Cryptosporidium muris (strain RN66) TaxID=441375 RepID=B6AA26_CRYMR|nr:uncharacterized protein CMU_041370 [Cryptosporidium muris RN66]EEA05067.1 hypothetical protein, conserved [Cryptosporidium muris RN66]|eukprot:XP_002139416.1 hypothetical protein [Cryptosporidium muris RN66]
MNRKQKMAQLHFKHTICTILILSTIYGLLIADSELNYLSRYVLFVIYDDFPLETNVIKVPSSHIYCLWNRDTNYFYEDSLLIPILFRYSDSNLEFDWFFILSENTRFDPFLLEEILKKGGVNSKRTDYLDKLSDIPFKNRKNRIFLNEFLGAQLNDEVPSIVHHYNIDKHFAYPYYPSGFAISRNAIMNLKTKMIVEFNKYAQPRIYTDPIYELSKVLKELLNVSLTDIVQFCTGFESLRCGIYIKSRNTPVKCATWTISSRISPNCPLPNIITINNNELIDPNDVVISVKTTGKFHGTRVTQIARLWANRNLLKYSTHPLCPKLDVYEGHNIELEVLSDKSETIGNIQTIDLGVGNQIKGHCVKFYSMLHYLYKKYLKSGKATNKRYFVIVDDDTLVLPNSLLNVLSIIDQTRYKNEKLYMGLRYSLGSILQGWNIDYATGGAGIVINANTLVSLVNCSVCSCSGPTEPDDMAMGRWCKFLGIKAINYPGFYQAEPYNYHPYYIEYLPIITFHKLSDNFKMTIINYSETLFSEMYPHIDKVRSESSIQHDEL